MANSIGFKDKVIKIDEQNRGSLLVRRKTKHWYLLLKSNNLYGEIYHIASNDKEILLYTTKGMFISYNGAKSWERYS